jgi:sigma-E factor negative regulatory protein RseC
MIEEEAIVTQLEAERIWVERTSKPACGSCSQACATAAVGDYFGKSTVRMAVLSPIEVQPGDRVVVGIEEDTFIKGLLRVYLAPLAGLLAGAILGKAIGASFSLATDAAALAGGLLGLIGTLIFLKFAPGLPRDKLQPIVLRKLS